MSKLKRARPQRTCRVCGCTQHRACPGGCHWIAHDLCSACGKQPTKAEREAVINHLSGAHGSVEFKADGHDVVVRVERVKTLSYALVVYVDGYFRGEFIAKGNEIGQKFLPQYSRCFMGKKALEEYRKAFGKRETELLRQKSTYTATRPWWGAPLPMLRKWARTCRHVEVVRIGYGDHASMRSDPC